MLYHAMMKACPVFYTKIKNELAAEVKFFFTNSNNSYERAEWLRVLGDDPYQYLTLSSLSGKTSQPVEKTALIEAMGQILVHPEFIKAYGSKYIEAKSYIVNFLVAVSKSGDAGSTAAARSHPPPAKWFRCRTQQARPFRRSVRIPRPLGAEAGKSGMWNLLPARCRP